MISAVCVTYGRVRFLQSAIGDFLAQCDAGRHELVVLNTFPKQSLQADDLAGVKIVNMVKRPDTLGAARNVAVELATYDRVVVWDDDDAYLPHHLSTFAKHWSDNLDWIWLDTRLCASGDNITSIGIGCHGGCFGFTKRAWKAVGGYPSHLSVGEDRVLVQKIVKDFPGKRVAIDGIPPFIARWGQGTYHISGQGDDKAGTPSAYQRSEADLSRRLASGKEKTGVIDLVPHFDRTWMEKANQFWAVESKKNSVNEVCVIELGRYGDIVNILPILQHINNVFGKPTLMVSREFADILDGVSYVTPYVVGLKNDQLSEALAIAKKRFKHILCAQVWGGTHFHQDHQCESYNMESWRACGFLHKFHDLAWPPIFDRRDDAREESLTLKIHNGKPLILANLTHSISSPFPAGPKLLASLQERLGDRFNIVDIGAMKLHRIYDLIGLMNWSDCLVTVDSAQLHLAAASRVKVVALVNDKPWLGSTPRCLAKSVFKYSEAGSNPARVVDAVESAALTTRRSLPSWGMMPIESLPPQRRIFHCCERHAESNHLEAHRKTEAQRSWNALYSAGVVRTHLEESHYPRDARDIGEERALPFLKDVLSLGLESSVPGDIVFITNDDNFLHPLLPDMLRFHISLYDCGCAQRCEFKRAPMPPASRPPGDFTHGSESHMGRDLFAFTKEWLLAHWEEIPDFILGCSDWDLCLCAMIRNHFGIKTSRKNLEQVIPPAEMPLGYVSHVWHPPHWNRPDYSNTAKGQIHNRKLFKAWASKHAKHLVFDKNGCI